MEARKTFPRISIGVPTYNGGHRIMKAFDSIFNQNYPNLELIIGDNCSSDNTQALCLDLVKAHPEIAIRYFRHKENLGILKNFEFTLQQATGKYFMWVADDDILEGVVLFKYVDFFENNPEYVNISGKIQYWKDSKIMFDEQFTLEQDNPNSRVISFYAKVRWTGMIHGIMRRELAQQIPMRQVFGSDYHFIASVAYLGKIKSFDFVGYHKWLGGLSRHWKTFAKSLGEPDWGANFPRLKIAYDALLEPYRSPVYQALSHFSRLSLGISSGMAVIYNYYLKMSAESVGNRVKKGFLPQSKWLSMSRQNRQTAPGQIDIDKS